MVWYLITDTYKDFKWIFNAIRGKEKAKYSLKEFVNSFDIKEIWKEYWWVFLLIAVGFGCGYIYAANKYAGLANKFVVEYCTDRFFYPKNWSYN